jgi:hypothetical protein
MRVLVWHVHGSYTNAFVRGDHEYLIPTTAERGPDGVGRSTSFAWPPNVVEIREDEARHAPVDVVVLQRPAELHDLAQKWLGGRVPGRDVPAIYLEHNTPPTAIGSPHPAADRKDLLLVHVTYCNALCWDTGSTPATVIEHGIPDPGLRYTGEQPRLAIVVNEPERRGRAVGTDLIPRFRAVAPVDLFGIDTDLIGGFGSLHPEALQDELAARRVYVHTSRWTSLGLSLLEAMHLGVPVVALATAETPRAVGRDCGSVSNDPDALVCACRALLADHDLAREIGRRGRARALRRYGLRRFLDDWDRAFEEVTR